MSRGSDAVSPTAHYTGHTWVRNGLSHPELATREGRVMYEALRPTMAFSRALGGPTLEGLLLARHRIIDSRLDDLIEAGTVSQVVEIACGMSPRGWRFAERYGDRLTYVEADLPAMARRKREALERIGPLGEHHRVAELDALRDLGEGSLAALAETLDPEEGLAIITEGLLTYFDDDAVADMWKRFAATLHRFPAGAYLADLRLAVADPSPSERIFNAALSTFVRGQVHPHFADEAAAEEALVAAGFDAATVHSGASHPAAAEIRDEAGAAVIRVVEGSCLRPSSA